MDTWHGLGWFVPYAEIRGLYDVIPPNFLASGFYASVSTLVHESLRVCCFVFVGVVAGRTLQILNARGLTLSTTSGP